ncbi:hypothetical protein THAOC_10582, partial [Thalassiosira oceanica]
MVALKIAPFLTLAMAMANAGTNKFALGLDAPEYDQLARSLAVSSKQRAVWTPTSSHSDGGSLDAGGAGGASEDEGGMHISRSGGADDEAANETADEATDRGAPYKAPHWAHATPDTAAIVI